MIKRKVCKMAKEKAVDEKVVEEKSKSKELKYKVVSYGDYLPRARSEFGATENAYDVAIGLLFTENEVVAQVQKGGETKFVVKA